MWVIDEIPIEDKLQLFLSQVLEVQAINFPQCCPICAAQDVHMYFNKSEFSRIGGVWIWCSNCKRYFHGSIIPPVWWENYTDVPQSELMAAPDVLEKMKSQVDKHFNCLVERELK